MLRRIIQGACLLSLSLSLNSCAESQPENSDYVDITIGNVVPYLVPTFPTMQRPNQMMRMYPVKADYISDQLLGLPMQVWAHRKPGMLQIKASSQPTKEINWAKPMIIEHDLEVYHPWFYSTYLIEDDIRISYSPGEKTAIYKFEFPKDAASKTLRIAGSKDSFSDVNGSEIYFEEKIHYDTKGEDAHRRTMSAYVYGEFTDAMGNAITPNYKKLGKSMVVEFIDDNMDEIYYRYGVSYIDGEQAKANLTAELSGVSFDELTASAKASWDVVMNQIQVEGGTDAQKRTLYSSLYRTYERMVDINEGGRYFSGYDGKVHESDRPFFVDDWIWDTYRATHPMRTILTPTMENDMLNSYVEMYKQSGWLPTFPQVHGNHLCMNSYHSAAILLDGYRKGLTDYDVEAAYEGIKKNMTEATFIPWRQHVGRTSLDEYYMANGYFPALKLGEAESEPQVDDFEKRQSVAVTLGVSYDFWVMSEFAKDLGKTEDVANYTRYAYDYKKLWCPEHRLFIPKGDDDKFLDIDPKKDGGKGYREYYDENNGWTYAWDVPHDVEGLTQLLGGKAAAEARLDQLFREPLGMKKNEFVWDGGNSTGMVGQFSMGNEPSFHIPYLYNYFDAAWKTQQRVRFLLDVWFKDNIFGIPGDEDGGGMTAFVVMSSLGIYPVTPGLPIYTITSPLFEKSTIALEDGKTFTIEAKGASKKNKYIQRAFIDGTEIFTPFITHDQIMSGATLTLELAELPNKEWGKGQINF